MMNIKETCCIVLIFFVLTNTGTETVRASNRGRKCDRICDTRFRSGQNTIASSLHVDPHYMRMYIVGHFVRGAS